MIGKLPFVMNVPVHTRWSSFRVGLPVAWATMDSVRKSMGWRPGWRQVSTMVSSVSTKRLPAALWESLRQRPRFGRCPGVAERAFVAVVRRFDPFDFGEPPELIEVCQQVCDTARLSGRANTAARPPGCYRPETSSRVRSVFAAWRGGCDRRESAARVGTSSSARPSVVRR